MPLKLTFLIFLLISLSAGAQKSFSGRLSYSIEYLEVPDDMKGVEDKLPSEVHIITDGKCWRAEQSTEINGDYCQIYIEQKDSIYETITIGPKRVQVSYRTVKSMKTKAINSIGSPVLGQETEICEISDPSGVKQNIIQLKSYNAIPSLFYDGLTGIPTWIQTNNSGLKTRLKLSSLKEEPIDETYFALPDDYKLIDTALYQSWLR